MVRLSFFEVLILSTRLIAVKFFVLKLLLLFGDIFNILLTFKQMVDSILQFLVYHSQDGLPHRIYHVLMDLVLQ